MAPKLKFLRKVKDTRKRLRDVAIGDVAQAELLLREALDKLRRAEGELDGVYDKAAEVLHKAKGADAFIEVQMMRAWGEQSVNEASATKTECTTARDDRRDVLIQREVSLRQSEKLLEREDLRVRKDAHRKEQKANDDRSAVRMKKRA